MQHINLFSQLDRTVEPAFSARQQVIAIALISVLMVMVYLFALVEKNNLADTLDDYKRQQLDVSNELEKLQARKKKLQDNPLLDQEIAGLERDIKFRQKIMASLGSGNETVNKGFAEQLSGLARQHINGLWFTAIELKEGGQKMALTGRSQEPEYIPRYLQKLSNESVFSGQHFKVLRMSTPEDDAGVMNFEVRASEVVATQ